MFVLIFFDIILIILLLAPGGGVSYFALSLILHFGFMRFYARQLARDGARHSPRLTGRVVLGPVGPVTASRGVRASRRRGASKNNYLATGVRQVHRRRPQCAQGAVW